MRNLKPILEQFGEYVVSQSRLNLTKGGYKNKGQNASGSLSKSLAFEVMPNGKNWVVEFIMQYYGQFIDKGVSGTKVRRNTPYRFRSKGGKQGLKGMPPPSAFDQWRIRKGIAPRDDKGRFLPRKAANFAIARSIFEKGIKPSLFFTTPFNKAFEDLNQTILDDFNVQITKTFKKLENGKN
jgi:hypothetical protein